MSLLRRRIGGESTGRGWWGGAANRTRAIGLSVVFVIGVMLTLVAQTPGLAISLGLAAVVYVGTIRTHHGSILERVRRWWWWRETRRAGRHVFAPVEMRPDVDLEGLPRAERKDVERGLAAYREWPDGVEGLYWLQAAAGRPGIAWHVPTGEPAYLSVAFSVSGAVRGLEADEVVNGVSMAFGRMVARLASRSFLPSGMQVLTRAVPVDSARHEAWVLDHLSESTPEQLLRSYDDVVRQVGRGGLAQRHFVVLKWPLSTTFRTEAARHAPGQVGWLELMHRQIPIVRRQLQAARLGEVSVLTAAQALAVIRHQQVPEWPLDEAGTIGATGAWFPSVDEFSYTQVTGPTPDGGLATWLHRTAVVNADDLDTGERTAMWLTPLLGRMDDQIMRTVSIQFEGVPAGVARHAAMADVTADIAEITGQQEKGSIDVVEAQARKQAAQSRLRDLEPGGGYAGAGWAMHITISAQNREELSAASARLAEAAEESGISRLSWLEAHHGAAQSYTWPMARGMAEVGQTTSARLETLVAGQKSKEALA